MAERERHSSSKRIHAGASPAGSASLYCQVVSTVARRPVKPRGVGASPALAAKSISGCNVSSRRPCSERGGRRCNSCHPDHFKCIMKNEESVPAQRRSGFKNCRSRREEASFLRLLKSKPPHVGSYKFRNFRIHPGAAQLLILHSTFCILQSAFTGWLAEQ